MKPTPYTIRAAKCDLPRAARTAGRPLLYCRFIFRL